MNERVNRMFSLLLVSVSATLSAMIDPPLPLPLLLLLFIYYSAPLHEDETCTKIKSKIFIYFSLFDLPVRWWCVFVVLEKTGKCVSDYL